MRKIDLLRQLQSIDLALDQQRERREQTVQRLADRAELDRAIEHRQTCEQRLRALHGQQKDLELQTEQLQAKLKEIDDKLYSGKVRSPKELDSLSKEADQFKQTIRRREDVLLDILEQIELVQAETDAARASHERADLEWRQRQTELSGQLAQVEGDITRLESERDRLRGSLDASTLRLYDGLRRTRGGVAVVEIRQRTCQGCRVTLPMSEEMRARTSESLVTCQSCGRILFAGP